MTEPTPRNGYGIPHRNADPGICRWCGEALGILKRDGTPDRRIAWHPACVETYKLSWPQHVRARVRERDKGVCRECLLDCEALRRLLDSIPGHRRWRALANLGLGHSEQYRDLWDADHVTPLVDGGSLELANVQTLCLWCHRRKTASEARERAKARRSAKASQGALPMDANP